MKKTHILIAVSIALLIISAVGFNIEVDSHAHYFSNGIICGSGIWLLILQLQKLNRQKVNQ